jgi:hypothetical protein
VAQQFVPDFASHPYHIKSPLRAAANWGEKPAKCRLELLRENERNL